MSSGRIQLFNTESDVEEDGKTAKAVLEDQQEFYNEIGRIIDTGSDVKEDGKTVKAVLEGRSAVARVQGEHRSNQVGRLGTERL